VADFFNELNKSKIPHLVLTAETDDFDDEVTQQWRDEGFDAVYVPMGEDGGGGGGGGAEHVRRVHAAGDAFGPGEYYGIVGKYISLSCHFLLVKFGICEEVVEANLGSSPWWR